METMASNQAFVWCVLVTAALVFARFMVRVVARRMSGRAAFDRAVRNIHGNTAAMDFMAALHFVVSWGAILACGVSALSLLLNVIRYAKG